MPFVPYTLFHVLISDGHEAAVNVLAFSPLGDYLASGGDDRAVAIWDVRRGILLQKMETQSPVLSLTWHPGKKNAFFFGCQDGALCSIDSFKPDEKNVAHEVLTGIEAAVECLDIDSISNHLAIGIGPEVQVARQMTDETYATFVIMPHPPVPHPTHDGDDRVRPRSVHLLPGGNKLIVSYLNHGVVCWDIMKKSVLWTIHPPSSHPHIGSSCLSPDLFHILVYNLHDGMDLYKAKKQTPIQRYQHPIVLGYNYPMKVAFTSNGTSVVSGAQDGEVRIWDRTAGTQQQVLSHGNRLIQAISTYQGAEDALIATANADTSDQYKIMIWKAPIKGQCWEIRHMLWILEYRLMDALDALRSRSENFRARPFALTIATVAMIILTTRYNYICLQLYLVILNFVTDMLGIMMERGSTIWGTTREACRIWWRMARPRLQELLRNLLEDD